MTESEIITAACNGCEEAFEKLYSSHISYVKAVGRAILHTTDLDDLCQETFLLAFTKIANFRQDSNFRTWITRIAMNQCLMVLRRNRQVTNGESRLLQLDAEMADEGLLEQCVFVAEDRNLESLAARLDIPKLLRVLKPLQRQVLRMAYLDDIPDQEIAQKLGMSVASVKSTLHHAKRRLREVHNKS